MAHFSAVLPGGGQSGESTATTRVDGGTSREQGSSTGEPFSYIPRDQFTWDGEASWEWDYPKTLYFEPVAGLGNRLRALGMSLRSLGLTSPPSPSPFEHL